VGPCGTPIEFNEGDMGGLEQSVDAYLNNYNIGIEMEKNGGLPSILINTDLDPYKETSAVVGQSGLASWQATYPQYVEYMEQGVKIQPVNAAMYARLQYTPWVDFPPQESNPLDDWIEIYNSF